MKSISEINRNKMVKDFFQLVEIESEPGREREMADFLKKRLKILGAQVKEDKCGSRFGGEAGNIIADFPGDEAPVFLLSAHMDRVLNNKRINPRLEGKYIINNEQGAVGGDDAAGIIAILEILRVIQQDFSRFARVRVIFTVAEEMAMLGSRYLEKEELLTADYGFVFDGEGEAGTIIYRAPMQIAVKFDINGRKNRGIDANKIVTSALNRLGSEKNDSKLSVNLAISDGGSINKKSEDRMELTGSIRGLDRGLISEQLFRMQRILKEEADKHGGEVKFSTEKLYPSFSLPRNSDIIKTVTEAVDEDMEIKLTTATGGSDANIFNDKGLPAINLGVGLENSHTTKERVNMATLEKLVKIILQVLKKKRGRL